MDLAVSPRNSASYGTAHESGALKPRNCYILCLFTATPFTFILTTELKRPVSSEIRATSGFSAMEVGLL